MKPIYLIVFLVVGFVLCTCSKSDAHESFPVPGCFLMANGGGYAYPENPSPPDSGLFPRAEPDSTFYGPRSVSVDLPTSGGFLDFLQTIMLTVIGWYMRRQTVAMIPTE